MYTARFLAKRMSGLIPLSIGRRYHWYHQARAVIRSLDEFSLIRVMAESICSVDADTVDNLVSVAGNDVKVIEDYLCIGALLRDLIDVGTAHIHGNRFDVGPVVAQ